MTVIREADLVDSIAEALQYVSVFHPPDFIRAMAAAWEREENPGARQAMAQILVNSRMCALGRRPICQDTGTAQVSVAVGAQARLDLSGSLQDAVDEATRRAYRLDSNPLRASVVLDPLGARRNSGDNTPAMLTAEIVAGDRVTVHVSAKGGGSENKAKFTVLNPAESVADWVVRTVEGLGAGWCPPGILGIGVGGSADKAMALAKKALSDPIDMADLIRRGPSDRTEELRLEI
ncbi:MAG: fumarate hydratase, partial [Rhodobacteraceae bacterium]|nr:fumarate hydratase [Paracoccaceae bacterium]